MFVIFLTGNDIMLTVIPLLVIDHLQSLEMEPKSFTKVTPPPFPWWIGLFSLLAVKFVH